MPRYKKYDYSQSILIPAEFSKQILPGSIEYVINYMVEKKLNLRELELKYKNNETGDLTPGSLPTVKGNNYGLTVKSD